MIIFSLTVLLCVQTVVAQYEVFRSCSSCLLEGHQWSTATRSCGIGTSFNIKTPGRCLQTGPFVASPDPEWDSRAKDFSLLRQLEITEKAKGDTLIYQAMDEEIWESLLQQKQFFLFVLFTVDYDWCDNCATVWLPFLQTAHAFKDDPLVIFGVVDAEEEGNQKFLAKLNLEKYPTLLLFSKGTTLGSEYQGEVSGSGMFEFVNAQVGSKVAVSPPPLAAAAFQPPQKLVQHSSPVKQLTGENWEEFHGKTNLLVQFVAPWCDDCKKATPLLHTVATLFQKEEFVLGTVDIISGNSIVNKLEIDIYPTWLYFDKESASKGEKGVEWKPQVVSARSLILYINTLLKTNVPAPHGTDEERFFEKEMHVVSLTDKDFGKVVFDGTKHVIVHFVHKRCQDCHRFTPILNRIAGGWKEHILFTSIDAVQYPDIAKQYSGHSPSVVIKLFTNNNKQQPHTYKGELVGYDFNDWLNTHLDMNIEEPLEPEEQNSDSAVHLLSDLVFNETIADPSKTVLVQFMTPWCGACKSVALTYEELAVELKDTHPDIIIGKLDVSKHARSKRQVLVNDGVNCDNCAKDLPKIYMFPKAYKLGDTPVQFTDEHHTFDNLMKFVMDGHDSPTNEETTEVPKEQADPRADQPPSDEIKQDEKQDLEREDSEPEKLVQDLTSGQYAVKLKGKNGEIALVEFFQSSEDTDHSNTVNSSLVMLEELAQKLQKDTPRVHVYRLNSTRYEHVAKTLKIPTFPALRLFQPRRTLKDKPLEIPPAQATVTGLYDFIIETIKKSEEKKAEEENNEEPKKTGSVIAATGKTFNAHVLDDKHVHALVLFYEKLGSQLKSTLQRVADAFVEDTDVRFVTVDKTRTHKLVKQFGLPPGNSIVLFDAAKKAEGSATGYSGAHTVDALTHFLLEKIPVSELTGKRSAVEITNDVMWKRRVIKPGMTAFLTFHTPQCDSPQCNSLDTVLNAVATRFRYNTTVTVAKVDASTEFGKQKVQQYTADSYPTSLALMTDIRSRTTALPFKADHTSEHVVKFISEATPGSGSVEQAARKSEPKGTVITATADDFSTHVLANKSVNALVMFYEQPTKQLQNVMQQLADIFVADTDVIFVVVDIQKNQQLVKQFGLPTTTTVVLFDTVKKTQGSATGYSGGYTLNELTEFLLASLPVSEQTGKTTAVQISTDLLWRQRVMKATITAFVAFYSPECDTPECKTLDTVLDATATRFRYNTTVAITKIDATQNPGKLKAAPYKLTSYPTCYVFPADNRAKSTPLLFTEKLVLQDIVAFISNAVPPPPPPKQEEENAAPKDMPVATQRKAGIINLTSATFQQHVLKGASNNVLVVFYSTLSEALRNTIQHCANMFIDETDVVFSWIDITKNQDIVKQFGLPTTTTIVLFDKVKKAQGSATGYGGDISIDPLMDFLLDNLPVSSFTQKREAVELDSSSWESIVMQDHTDVLVDFYAPWCGHCKKLAPVLDFVATRFRYNNSVSITKIDVTKEENKQFGEKYQVKSYPTVYLFKAHQKDEDPLLFTLDRSAEKIVEFISGHKKETPSGKAPGSSEVLELTTSNFERKIANKSLRFLVMFYAPWCDHCTKLEPVWDELANIVKKDHPNCRVAKVDASAQDATAFAVKYKVKSFPTIKLFTETDKTGASKYYGPRGKDDLLQYLTTGVANKHKSDEDPADYVGSHVVRLSDDNFDSVVLDTTKDVLVEFYAPWCGHCKKLAPTYEKVAEMVHDHHIKDVVIAKLDVTVERELGQKFQIKGFPTMKWFQKHDKSGKKKYLGKRNPDALFEFVAGEPASEELKERKLQLAESGGDGEVDIVSNKQEIRERKKQEKEEKKTKEKSSKKQIWELSEDSHILPLTDNNFTDTISRGKHVLVMFYASWCSQSQALKPHFDTVANHLMKKHYDKLLIGRIDTTKNRKTGRFYKITTYPTVILFLHVGGNSSTSVRFKQGRSANVIIDWVRGQIQKLESGHQPGQEDTLPNTTTSEGTAPPASSEEPSEEFKTEIGKKPKLKPKLKGIKKKNRDTRPKIKDVSTEGKSNIEHDEL